MPSERPKFDYAQFRIEGTWREASEQSQLLKDTYARLHSIGEDAKASNWKEWSTRGPTTDTFIFWFEVWGPMTDRVVEAMPQRFFRKLTRLDYRWSLDRANYSTADIAECARATAGRASSVTQISSRARSKRGGRDAGGDFCAIGNSGSDRRITYYIRGREKPALEVQLRNLGVKRAIEAAWNRWENIKDAHFVDALTEYFEATARDLITTRTGLDFDVVVGDVDRPSIHTVFQRQEDLLEHIERAIEKLHPDAREALIETLTVR